MTYELEHIPHQKHTDDDIRGDIADEFEEWREETGGSMLEYYIEKHNRWTEMRAIVQKHQDVLAPWYLNDFALMTREIALAKEYVEKRDWEIRPPFNDTNPCADVIVIDTPEVDVFRLLGERIGEACERVMNVALDEVSTAIVRKGDGWGEHDDYGHLNAAIALLEVAACADKEALVQSFPNRARRVDEDKTKRPKRRKK